MKAIMYTTSLCPECAQAAAALRAAGLIKRVEQRSITSSLTHLKEFLALRERPAFADAKAAGFVGVPAFVLEDGTITLDSAVAFTAIAAKQTKGGKG